MASPAENKRTYMRFIERVVNAKDYDVADQIIAGDVISHDPFPGQKPGPAGVKDTFREFHAAFPDLHAEIKNLIAEDDKVVEHWAVADVLGLMQAVGAARLN